MDSPVSPTFQTSGVITGTIALTVTAAASANGTDRHDRDNYDGRDRRHFRSKPVLRAGMKSHEIEAAIVPAQ